MRLPLTSIVTLTGLDWLSLACVAAETRAPLTPKTAALLEAGDEPLKIVCFGDSITGVYNHTGGRWAYSDMLGGMPLRIYPEAKLTMVSARVGGNTTQQALRRIECGAKQQISDTSRAQE